MAKNYEILRRKYGDDVIGGMAATFLTEEELIGLHTDEDKMHALSAKMLDSDGEIKSQYDGLIESAYVRDWAELNELSPLAAQAMLAKHGTAQQQADAAIAISQSSFAQKHGLVLEAAPAADPDALEGERAAVGQALDSGPIGFNWFVDVLRSPRQFCHL